MNECLQIMFSGLVALSTVTYAVLTWRLVSETKKTRQLQITPAINAYFEMSEVDASFVYIILENIGYGVAKDVNFEIIKDFNFYDFEHQKLEKKGAIKHGLKNFYPKQKFRYLFTDLSKRYDEKIEDNLELKIKFNDINNKYHEKTLNLTLNELTGMGLFSRPDSYLGRVVYELEEIKKILNSKKNKYEE